MGATCGARSAYLSGEPVTKTQFLVRSVLLSVRFFFNFYFLYTIICQMLFFTFKPMVLSFHFRCMSWTVPRVSFAPLLYLF